MKVAVIEIAGYEHWIKSLGSDREWIVQMKQSEFSKCIQKEVTELNGFAFPLRYDFSIAFIDGIKCDAESFCSRLKEMVSSIFPLRVRAAGIITIEEITRQTRHKGDIEIPEERALFLRRLIE